MRITNIVLLLIQVLTISGSLSELELRKKLFSNANDNAIMVRPVMKNEERVNVNISLSVIRLLEINERSDFFSLVAWVKLSWNDYQLTWNPLQYENLTCIKVDPTKLWKPDIILGDYINDGNSEHAGFLNRIKTEMDLCYNGRIFRESRLFIKTFCSIDVRYYPKDYHKCVVYFEHHGSVDKVILTFDESEKQYILNDDWFYESLAWEITDNNVVVDTVTEIFYQGPLEYSSVRFYFIFRRKSVFFTDILLVSISLITLLTICTLGLNYESGERLGVALTLMLAALVFMVQVAQNIPLNAPGSSVPQLAIYFHFCLFLMTFVIISLLLISNFYQKKSKVGKKMKRVFDWLSCIRKYDNCNGSDMVLNQPNTKSNGDGAVERADTSADTPRECNSNQEIRTIIGNTLDRILFIFYMVVFIVGGLSIVLSISLGSQNEYQRMKSNVTNCGYDIGKC